MTQDAPLTYDSSGHEHLHCKHECTSIGKGGLNSTLMSQYLSTTSQSVAPGSLAPLRLPCLIGCLRYNFVAIDPLWIDFYPAHTYSSTYTRSMFAGATRTGHKAKVPAQYQTLTLNTNRRTFVRQGDITTLLYKGWASG